MNTPTSPTRALSPVQPSQGGPLQRSAFWVLLWSQSQNALHVEPVEDMLSSNRQAYSEDRRTDYVPVCIDHEEVVHQVADAIRHTMRARERIKAEKRELV